MLKIGIIDSGLPTTYQYSVLAARTFTEDNSFTEENSFTKASTNSSATTIDQLGHGSAVTHIISHNLAADLVCAKVFHDKLTCTPSQIAEAIHWLISMEVNIINMSFGLRTDRAVLREACQQALNHNIILVAAAPSQGDPVYPSNYTGIIKATGDARCQPNEIAWLNDQQADFGGFSGIPYQGPAGASIGCASVTGAIAQLKCQYPHYKQEQIIEALIKQSRYQCTQSQSKMQYQNKNQKLRKTTRRCHEQ